MAIQFISDTKTFHLMGKDISYLFFINEAGYPEHLYFGPRIGAWDDIRYTRAFGANSTSATPPGVDDVRSYNDYPSELSFFGTGDYREPAVLPVNRADSPPSEVSKTTKSEDDPSLTSTRMRSPADQL